MRFIPSILLAGVAAGAVAVAGCGSGDVDPGARASAPAASAVRQADAVCADIAHRRDAIQRLAGGSPPSEVAARAYAALAEVTVDRASALERVPLPSSGAPELRRYLVAVHREERLAWQVRRAVAQGDLARAKSLVEQASAASGSTRALARAAGLRICGERT